MAFWLTFMAWEVWPTPWEHWIERRESMLLRPDGIFLKYEVEVRRNRITGERQIERGDGSWVPYYVE